MQAQDQVAAGWLWERSIELTGVDYAALGLSRQKPDRESDDQSD